jgi:two-component system chemotaxis response regulator CheB
MTLKDANLKTEIVVIGTSMGGLGALETILQGLSREFTLPIAVVQHRGVMSTDRLSATLRRFTHLKVRETHDKEPIMKSTLYLAPPDYHLMVEKGSFALSTEAPVLYARPSIDVLFESAADAYAERVVAVVLTGASQDGAMGAARVKARGGRVLVQSPATAESPAMPEAAIAAAQPDWILPLSEIGPFLNQLNCLSSEQI